MSAGPRELRSVTAVGAGGHLDRLARVGAAVAALVPLVILLTTIGGSFLYDDARMVLLNVGGSDHLLRAFVELRDNFYRPSFETVIALEGLAFGERMLPYHLVNLLIHALCTWLVYLIGMPRIGRAPAVVAALLFFGGTTHAEAIIWISGLHSLLAAVGCLAAVVAVRRAERATASTAVFAWVVLALLCWLFGLFGKENGYTLPLAMAALWWIERPSLTAWLTRRRAAFLAPALGLMALYAPLRLSAGTGYDLRVTPLMLLKNASYYTLTAFVPLPDDYRYLSDLSSWNSAPLYGAIALALVLPGLAWGAKRIRLLAWRNAVAWLVWAAVLSLPALPILAERESYLPSAGVALALATLSGPALTRAIEAASPRIGLGAVALVSLLLANWIGLAERGYYWNEAARVSDAVTSQLLEATASDDRTTRLAIYNAPDQVRFAHVQGTHLCWTLQYLSDRRLTVSRCDVVPLPDDGPLTKGQALADAQSKLVAHPEASAVRVAVFAGERLEFQQLLTR